MPAGVHNWSNRLGSVRTCVAYIGIFYIETCGLPNALLAQKTYMKKHKQMRAAFRRAALTVNVTIDCFMLFLGHFCINELEDLQLTVKLVSGQGLACEPTAVATGPGHRQYIYIRLRSVLVSLLVFV